MAYSEHVIDFIKLNLEDALIDIHQGGLVPNQNSGQFPIEEIQDNIQRLETYYKDGKLYEILILMAYFRSLIAIPPELHFVFGMTMFRLGRMKPALREIAIAIELQFLPEKKRMFLIHFQSIFEYLHMKENALKCMGEIMENSKAELFENSNHDFSTTRDRFLNDQADLNKLLVGTSCNDDFHPISKPLHLQADSMLKAGGSFPNNSLGKLCVYIHEDLSTIIQNLQEWLKEGKTVEVGHLFFNAILSLSPLYLFKILIGKHEALLLSYLKYELSISIINLDKLNYNLDPVSLISRLRKLKGTRETWSMVELMVIHKTILGFIPYYKQKYDLAEKEFQWVHKFITKLDEYLIIPPNNKILSDKTAQIILIYIGYCKINNPTSNTKSCFIKYLTTSATALNEHLEDNDEEDEEGLFNVQSKVYITYGLVSEQLSKLESKSIIIEDESGVEKYALQYDKSRMLSSVKNYIQSLSHLYDDDYMIVPIYDRILWCLLMIGGIHLKSFYFFYILRNHYLTKLDYNYLFRTNDDDYRLLNNENILDNYENAWDIIEKICSVAETSEVQDTNDIWSSNHGNILLIPQIYEQSNHLVLLADSYELRNDDKQFIESTRGTIAPKTKSCLKKSVSQDFAFTICESKELISTWFNTYKLQKKPIPDIVHPFL